MTTLSCCHPRQSVLDRFWDFVVKLSALSELTESETAEFLDSNVLTSGMEELVMQTADRISGGPSRGIHPERSPIRKNPCQVLRGMLRPQHHAATNTLRQHVQTLPLAVENHRS